MRRDWCIWDLTVSYDTSAWGRQAQSKCTHHRQRAGTWPHQHNSQRQWDFITLIASLMSFLKKCNDRKRDKFSLKESNKEQKASLFFPVFFYLHNLTSNSRKLSFLNISVPQMSSSNTFQWKMQIFLAEILETANFFTLSLKKNNLLLIAFMSISKEITLNEMEFWVKNSFQKNVL